jgi:hypothetical protein
MTKLKYKITKNEKNEKMTKIKHNITKNENAEK